MNAQHSAQRLPLFALLGRLARACCPSQSTFSLQFAQFGAAAAAAAANAADAFADASL